MKTDKYLEYLKSKNISESNFSDLKFVWLDYFNLLDKRAKRDLNLKNTLQITALISSILIPVLANIDYVKDSIIFDETQKKVFITLLGLLSSISLGLLQKFNFEDRWLHYRRYAELVRINGEEFLAQLNPTSDNSSDVKNFLLDVQNIKKNENSIYTNQFQRKAVEKKTTPNNV